MDSKESGNIPLPEETRQESSTSANLGPVTSTETTSSQGLQTNEKSNASSSNSDGLEKKDSRPKYEPIRGASYEDNTLEKTLSQMYGPLSEHERGELRQIASLHRSKTVTTVGDQLERKDTIAGISEDDPRLDPESSEFDIYIWARAFMRAMDEEGIRQTRASFAFRDLNVSGSGSALSLQSDVASAFLAPLRMKEYLNFGHRPHEQILQNFDGVINSGEMLIVLGRPGSGCSTLLKTICGELAGLHLDDGSIIQYSGIPQPQMIKEFRGEMVYNQEVDKHFPHLTVGETLTFATAARTPQSRVKGITRKQYIEHMTKVVMSVFGLSHTRNTKVGNEYIRGVSGGERKVCIKPALLISLAGQCFTDD